MQVPLGTCLVKMLRGEVDINFGTHSYVLISKVPLYSGISY